MSHPLIILDDAEDELRAAVDRYEQHATGLGDDLRLEIERALELVSALPRSGSRVPGVPGHLDVRRTFVRRFPFSVIYYIEPAVIWVVAFAHHRRRPGYWKHRLP